MANLIGCVSTGTLTESRVQSAGKLSEWLANGLIMTAEVGETFHII